MKRGCKKNFKIITKHVENRELDQFGPGACAARRKLHLIILSTFQMNSNVTLFNLVKLDFRHVPKFEF
jgi:hypothetical protein